MSTAEFGLALGVFLACAVECVEALTIILAVGMTRSWMATLAGAGTAVLGLGALVAIIGPAITLVPIATLRIIVGVLLLYYGAGWLRKAILRQAGLKAKHDEQAIWEDESKLAALAPRSGRFDAFAFAASFKGVALEGLEVVIIVLTLGAGNVGLASVAAAVAIVLVAMLGIALRRPLARVPENAMKLAVGSMLVSFGAFWGLEGLGFAWPGGDAALLALVPSVALGALGAARLLQARARAKELDGRPRWRHMDAGEIRTREEAWEAGCAYLHTDAGQVR